MEITTSVTEDTEMTADEIGVDVAENHVSHQRECPDCTWWYCEHYECDCDRDHSLD